MSKFIQRATTKVESLIKPETNYEWFVYMGKPYKVTSRQGTTFTFTDGAKYGVRKSASGKDIRMILKELGPNKVFTLDLPTAKYLANHSL